MSWKAELKKRIEARFAKAGLRANLPPSMGLGFDWSGLVNSVVSTVGTVYTNKETAKYQSKYGAQIAEAEARKMLAETELELAKSTSVRETAALVEKQNELQKMINSMQFANVQKYVLYGVGSLGLIWGFIVLQEKMQARKKRAR